MYVKDMLHYTCRSFKLIVFLTLLKIRNIMKLHEFTKIKLKNKNAAMFKRYFGPISPDGIFPDVFSSCSR